MKSVIADGKYAVKTGTCLTYIEISGHNIAASYLR